jgi:nucleoside-diphosphate kinase
VPAAPETPAVHPNKERTFLMLKPDAVQRGLAGNIIGRFEKKGFKLVAMKLMTASTDLLRRHYADLAKKPFFPDLIRCDRRGPPLSPRPLRLVCSSFRLRP